MPDEKMAKYTSLAVAALPLLTSILSAGSFLLYSLSWFVAKMGGFFIALAIYRKLRHKKAKENDTKIIESLRNRPESAIFREKFTVIDVDYRDESYTTIESHTTIQHTHTSAGLISTPHTTYSSKHNEKKVQDLWLRDANGEERRIRLVNHDLSVRGTHEVNLVYMCDGNLEYIENITTGGFSKFNNYVLNYKALKSFRAKQQIVIFSLMSTIPGLGIILAAGPSVLANAQITNRIKRSYAGKAMSYASLSSAAVASVYSLAVVFGFMSRRINLEQLLSWGIMSAVIILIIQFIANSITSDKIRKHEESVLAVVNATR